MAGRARILVVDDDASTRALVRAIFEDEDYEVESVSDGQTGIRAFDTFSPSCVVLDVRMAGLDGFQVCELIRRRPCGADVPILFLTALRDPSTLDRALQVGANDVISKPALPCELILRVQTALKMQALSVIANDYSDLVRSLEAQRGRLLSFLTLELETSLSIVEQNALRLLQDAAVTGNARTRAQEIRGRTQALLRTLVELRDSQQPSPQLSVRDWQAATR